jgi:phosphohistidine phosphatase SixA
MLLIIKANEKLPALTCQDVGRELYHKRYNVVQIIGHTPTLRKIAWIFAKVSDMFDLQFQYASIIVRRARNPEIPDKTLKSEATITINHSIRIPEHSMS